MPGVRRGGKCGGEGDSGIKRRGGGRARALALKMEVSFTRD